MNTNEQANPILNFRTIQENKIRNLDAISTNSSSRSDKNTQCQYQTLITKSCEAVDSSEHS